MDEAVWNSYTDPQKMLKWLRSEGKLSERKLRLFAVTCCRRIWPLLSDERSRRAVEVAERYADGRAGEQERSGAQFAALEAAEAAAIAYEDGPPHSCQTAAAEAATDAALAAVCQGTSCSTAFEDAMTAANLGNLHHTDGDARDIEYAAQAALLHDLFGNPFRPPPAIDPTWLAWNGGTARRLASAIYEDRCLPEGTLDTGRLGVLADALEESGCANEELLGHLRGPGPHVRGCWPIDLLLGKS